MNNENLIFDYIRNYYNVPAKKGKKILFDGKLGTIVGVKNQYLKILLEDEKRPGCYHPTYKMEYLD